MARVGKKPVQIIENKKWFYISERDCASFDYVWFKSQLLEQWLIGRNETPRRRVFASHYGTVAGYDVYLELIAQVQKHCGQWNVDCTAMLCPALCDYEGIHIRIDWPNGKYSLGRVERRGRVIKYHELVKDGNKYGSKIHPWNLDGAEITMA